MKFSDALKMLEQCENQDIAYIRRRGWNEDVQIRIMPDRVYSPCLARFDRFSSMPWMPNYPEMLQWDDWDFAIGKTTDEICTEVSKIKKQIKEMQKK